MHLLCTHFVHSCSIYSRILHLQSTMDMALILRRPVRSVLYSSKKYLILSAGTLYKYSVEKRYLQHHSIHTHNGIPTTFISIFGLLYSTPCSILLQYSHRKHMDHTHAPAKTTRSGSCNNFPSSYIVPVHISHNNSLSGELLSNGPSPAQPGVTAGPGQSLHGGRVGTGA